MQPILSLSTAWCSHRHTDGYVMLREMADLGFTHVELSHGIRITLVPGILKALEEGMIQVGSTHNFCPLPPGVNQAAPNLYECSSRDGREREQWLRYTKRSLDFAAQVKAKVLVCHLGSVVFFWLNPVRHLERHLRYHPEAGRTGEAGYKALAEKALAKLRKRMGPFWDNTRASILKVLDYAKERNVKLAFENREKFEELPVDPDFGQLFSGLPEGALAGYWHDTGHAEIKQDLGLLEQRLQLAANESRLLGFHLHDVSADGHDHQPVGSGRIDFQMISEFWRPHQILVLELGPKTTVDEVKSSKARIEALLKWRGFPRPSADAGPKG
jgi:sugar phosphate isomerase/epimerase